MDLSKLASTLLSSDSLKGLSDVSGASTKDVKNVLKEALPALLGGADEQAKNSDTAESFTKALAQHAKDDTSSLAGFLGNVDLADGSKIIGHLLGAGKDSTTTAVAEKSGVSGNTTATILSAAAPLLMSLLGQQADEDDDRDSGVATLMGSLLSNIDVGELLTGLLTDQDETPKKKSTKASAKSSSNSGVAGLLGGILKKLLK